MSSCRNSMPYGVLRCAAITYAPSFHRSWRADPLSSTAPRTSTSHWYVSMKKRMLFVLTSLFVVAAQVFAQQQTVTGKVTSEQGVALSGVTVTLKGTTTRAVTN